MSIILNIFFNVSCKLLLMNLLSLKKKQQATLYRQDL